jgi:hypothetical protein
MTILASKSAFSSHWIALESYLAVSASRGSAKMFLLGETMLLQRVMPRETEEGGLSCLPYLGVAPLVREIPRMDQDITLGQLDGAIVSVADAHDPCPPCQGRRGRWSGHDFAALDSEQGSAASLKPHYRVHMGWFE